MTTYFTDLFTPETWKAFREHGTNVSGFRERQRQAAERVSKGDILCCYLVRLSRWCGLLEVTSDVYIDASPIFADPDPFVVRFKVRPLTILDPGFAIPIFDAALWPHLSITRDLEIRSFGWAQTANMRSSLRALTPQDGELLRKVIFEQAERRRSYPLSPQDVQRLTQRQTVHAADRSVLVEVPIEPTAVRGEREAQEEPELSLADEAIGTQPAQSLKMQAVLARIGVEMGFRVWVPRNNKQAILDQLPATIHSAFLNQLPLNYDDVTLRTIEQIDVIWLRNRSMARAFEVEHTTAIYSGLLRMADLLALQPNMDIRLHIVAPDDKRGKVLREIKRPVFSLLERGPLYESCSFLPYSAVNDIAAMDHLRHTNDTVIDEFEEFPEDE
jgi:hypothetical protein